MKIWAYLAIAVVVIGGAKWAYDSIYDAGWNAAVVGQEQAIRDAKAEAVAEERAKRENTDDIAEKEIVVEERIVEVTRDVEVEIPVYVERIVELKPDCYDLGDDFAGLLNRQVNSGAGREVDSSAVATESDP